MKTIKNHSLIHKLLLILMALVILGQILLLNDINWVGVSNTLVFSVACDISAMVCLAIFYIGLPSKLMENAKMKYLVYLLCIVFLTIQVDIVLKLFQGKPEYRLHVYVCNLLCQFLTETISLFFYLFTRKAVNAKRNFGTALALVWWIISIVLYITNIWHNLFFTVDENAILTHTVLGTVEYYVYSVIVQIAAIICMYKFDTKKETRIIFYGFNIIPLAISLIFRYIFGIDVFYVGIATAIMVCYAVFFSDLQNDTANVRQTFGRFFSPEMLDKLIDQANGTLLTPTKKKVTIISVSIRNYNTISQNLEADQVVEMINHTFKILSEIAEKNAGTVFNFWGYGFSVFYESVKENDLAADKALYCAIKLQNSVSGINIWNRSHAYPEIEIGVGVHSSELVLGSFGSYSQSFYKAIGKEANYSFEIEEKSVQDEVLISNATLNQIQCKVDYQLVTHSDDEKLHGYDLYSVNSMGLPYNLKLDHYHASMIHLEKPYPLSFRHIMGSQSSDEIFHGFITDISKNKIYFKTDNVFPEIDIENAEHSCFYAKHTSDYGNCSVYHFIKKPLTFDKWYNSVVATNPPVKKEKFF